MPLRPPTSIFADMTVCILAAGQGTRLRPLTSATPKPMLPVCGFPFLHLLLTTLIGAGVERIIIVVGYQASVIVEYGKEHFAALANISYVTQQAEGTLGALQAAEATLDANTTHVLSLYADVIVDLAFPQLARSHIQSQCECTMVTTAVENIPSYQAIEIDHHDRIIHSYEPLPLHHRPHSAATGHRLVSNCGYYCFQIDTLRTMLRGQPGGSLESALIPRYIARGTAQAFHNGTKFFAEFGTLSSYAAVRSQAATIAAIYMVPAIAPSPELEQP